jgi:GAF domain-containing protein/CheY-like chemotaxis protein
VADRFADSDSPDRARAESPGGFGDGHRLSDEQVHRASLAALLEINKKIGLMVPTDTLASSIAEEAARLLDVDNAGFRLVEGDELVLAGLAGTAQETMRRPRLKIGQSLSGLVVREGRTVVLDLPSPIDEHAEASRRLGYVAFLGVPLTVADRTTGVLTFRGRRMFTARDRELAEAFAGQAAIAIEHARLWRAATQQAQRMQALADVGRVLSETLDPEAVGRRVVESVCALLAAQSSALYRLEPGSGQLVALTVSRDVGHTFEWVRVLPPGSGMAGLAVREGMPVASPDILTDSRLHYPAALRARLEQSTQRALIAVPLDVKGLMFGALAVADRTGRIFDDEEVRLAQAFADQAALALENARLFSLEAYRRTQIETLAEIEKELAAELNSDRLLGLIVDRASRLFGGNGAIYLVDDARTLIPKAWTQDAAVSGRSVAFGEGVIGRCAELGRALIANDYPESPQAIPDFVTLGVRRAMAYPLTIRDRLVGLISMNRIGDESPQFQPEDLRTLESFARQAAIALENAGLYEETERRRREAEIVAELARTINASRDLDTILRRVTEGARDACASDAALIALREAGSESAVFRHSVGTREAYVGRAVEPGKGIGGQVLVSGRPFRTDDYGADPRISKEYADLVRAEGVVTTLAVPIKTEERVEGLLYVHNRSRRRFTEHDAAVLARLANHAAIAIRNVRLYESLEVRATRLRALAGTSRMVSSSLNTDEVLVAIARAAAELIQVPVVSFWVADEAAGTLEVRAFSDPASGTDFPITTLRFGEDGVGWVAAHRQRLHLPDVHAPGSPLGYRDWWRTHGLTSLLGVPVVFEDSLLAVLTLCGRTPFSLGRDEQDLLDGFVSQAAVALRNARLYRDAREYAERLRALEEVNRLVSSSLQMDQVLQNVAAAVGRFFDAPYVSLWVLDQSTGRLHRSLTYGRSELAVEYVEEMAVGDRGVGWAMLHREPIIWADAMHDERLIDGPSMLRHGLRYFTAYPIALGDRVLGAFHVNRATPLPDTPETASLLASLAAQAAVALDNARLYSETARRLDESRALLDVAAILNSTLDSKQLLEQVAMKIAQVCGVDRCSIERWDGDEVIPLMSQFADGRKRPDLLAAFASLPPYRPREVPVHARAIETRRPVVIDDTSASDLVPREWIEAFDLRSYMVVPLIRQDQVIGVMNLDYAGRSRAFRSWQVELAMAIAGQLALSLANTRLYDEAQERLRETQTLLAVGQTLSRQIPLMESARLVARDVARSFGADMVGVYVLDARKEALVPLAGYHVPKHLVEVLRGRPFVLARMPALREAVDTGHAVHSADVKNDPRFDAAAFDGVEPFSVLLAPTSVRGSAVGVLFAVWWGTGRSFRSAELRLIEGVAAQVGLAMENAELARQTQLKLRETEMLLSVSRTLSSTVDLQALLRHLMREVARAVDADTVGVWMLAGDQEWLEPTAGYHLPPGLREAGRRLRLSIGRHAFYAEAARTRRPVFSADTIRDPRVPADVFADFTHRSQLFVPIVAGERLIGGFAAVWWDRTRDFSPGDLAPVEAIANQGGVAIENARLFEENRRQVQELSVLHELSRALTGQLDFAAVLAVVRAQVPRVFAVRNMAVILRDEAADVSEVVLRITDGVADARIPQRYPGHPLGLAPIVLASGRPLRTEDYVAECTRHGVTPLAKIAPFRYWLGVPMRTGDVHGVITLSNSDRVFTKADERLLSNIADLTALALRSARLYEERSRAYGELAAAQDQLVRTEKLRALGEMASGVAHDFNNLLAAILGRAQLLLRNATEPRERKWLEVIERSALDGAQTVRRLQEFTRIRRDQPKVAVDLHQVIHDALDITQSHWRDEALRRGITIDVRTVLGPVPSVAGDPVELREAMTNLVLNAVDAMPHGGVLTLATARAGDEALVTVTDTGVGIPESVKAKIFDPFFTTKGPQGTGLGLSMTYGIISRHGGRIEVESTEGRGSTFRLTFPLPVSREPASPPPPPPPAAAPPLRCLVVDDEPAVGTLLGDVLGAGGHSAVVCTDGAEAIARFEAEPFDLVFTDLAMPGVSGWQMAHAVKAVAPDVPVFVVTGFGVELSPEECQSHGVEAVLVKPLSIQQIVDAAAQAAQRRARAPNGGQG